MSGQVSGLACISADCGSSDAMTLYPKGDAHCFSCQKTFSVAQVEEGGVDAASAPVRAVKSSPPLPTGSPANVPSRGLQEHSLAYYEVNVGFDGTNGEVSTLYFPIYRDNERTGEKVKDLANKEWTGKGSLKSPQLFGQKQAGTGKLLIITEGEEDCMAAYQMLAEQGKSYRVVSLPFGANTRGIKDNLEWVEAFETVTLNLDSDEVGKQAAQDIAEMITPGKVKIMSLPEGIKDANDFLLSKFTSEAYLKAVWNAKAFQPDGIVSGIEAMLEHMEEEEKTGPSVPYPWAGLNKLLYGMREREIVTWTAGTGIGKSAVMREIEHHLLKTTEDTVGILALEESIGRTSWGVIAVEANLPLSIKEERAALGYEPRSPDVVKWMRDANMDRLHSLDHWGSTGVDKLLNKVRYMIRGLGCKWVVLDHLSIVVSAMEQNDDERKTIDRIMTLLRKLTEETGAGMHLVSHLKRIDGRTGHEQGAEVSLSHLRGSQAIAQLSDAVVAMERNQQADTEKEANLTRLRVLKNRYAGLTGLCTNLAYDRDTGRLREITNVDEYLAPPINEAGV